MAFISNKSSVTKLFLASAVIFGLAIAGCGGGGGDSGTTNASAVANRYTVNLATTPNSTVFFGGNNITANISLVNNCASTTTSSSTTTTTSACGTVPLDSVAGKTVTISSSNPAALTFSPSTVITDASGNAQVNISAAGVNVSGVVQVTASATLSGNTYSASPVSVAVNNQVDRTITSADSGSFQIVDFTKNCQDFKTYIINVQNANGTISSNSVVTGSAVSAEIGGKQLGVFPGLGNVWLIQVRPPVATCLTSGATPQTGQATFSADPGDGTTPYQFGFRINFNTK
jgi:hypothetical protein